MHRILLLATCVSGLLCTPSILISRNSVPAPLQGPLLVLTPSSVSRLDCVTKIPSLKSFIGRRTTLNVTSFDAQ